MSLEGVEARKPDDGIVQLAHQLGNLRLIAREPVRQQLQTVSRSSSFCFSRARSARMFW